MARSRGTSRDAPPIRGCASSGDATRRCCASRGRTAGRLIGWRCCASTSATTPRCRRSARCCVASVPANHGKDYGESRRDGWLSDHLAVASRDAAAHYFFHPCELAPALRNATLPAEEMLEAQLAAKGARVHLQYFPWVLVRELDRAEGRVGDAGGVQYAAECWRHLPCCVCRQTAWCRKTEAAHRPSRARAQHRERRTIAGCARRRCWKRRRRAPRPRAIEAALRCTAPPTACINAAFTSGVIQWWRRAHGCRRARSSSATARAKHARGPLGPRSPSAWQRSEGARSSGPTTCYPPRCSG